MPIRRRGSRRSRAGLRISPGMDRFERSVDRALAAIPPPFDAALREVAIVVEDEPTREQLRDADGLYGIYEGIPRTEWAADSVPEPNKITLFRWALEDDFPDAAELEDEIRITVIHELAHHLGIDDDRLHELGVG
jgi:predicted Zn-dependent protease with MMP-like domain